MDPCVIADTHFGHANVIKHDNRPFSSIDEHDEVLIENWNKVVKPNGIIYHIGDLAFRNEKPVEWYLKRLNGTIHFVRGNHDDKGACKVPHLFASFQSDIYMKFNHQKIHMYHYPCSSWRASGRGSWLIYGHTHKPDISNKKAICVSCNLWNYKPVSFDEISAYMKDRQFENNQHEE